MNLLPLLAEKRENPDPLNWKITLRHDVHFHDGSRMDAASVRNALLSRIMVGARISIGLGCAVVLCSSLLGTVIGFLAGYHGGRVDEVCMRTTDIFLSLPEMVAALAIAGMMGPGTRNLLLALSPGGCVMPVWFGESPCRSGNVILSGCPLCRGVKPADSV